MSIMRLKVYKTERGVTLKKKDGGQFLIPNSYPILISGDKFVYVYDPSLGPDKYVELDVTAESITSNPEIYRKIDL